MLVTFEVIGTDEIKLRQKLGRGQNSQTGVGKGIGEMNPAQKKSRYEAYLDIAYSGFIGNAAGKRFQRSPKVMR